MSGLSVIREFVLLGFSHLYQVPVLPVCLHPIDIGADHSGEPGHCHPHMPGPGAPLTHVLLPLHLLPQGGAGHLHCGP